MKNLSSDKLVSILGYGGLVPFIAVAVLIWFEAQFSTFFLLQMFHVYSILVLVFLCGTWWGFAFDKQVTETLRISLLIGSTLLFVLFLAIMLALLMQNQWVTPMLGLAYLVFYIIERVLQGLPIDRHYRQMRLALTIIVVICHASIVLATFA